MSANERRIVLMFIIGFGCMRAWALTFLGDSGVTPPMSLELSSNMFYVFAPLIILTMALIMVAVPKRWSESCFLSTRAVAVSAGILCLGSVLLVADVPVMAVVPEALCAVGLDVYKRQRREGVNTMFAPVSAASGSGAMVSTSPYFARSSSMSP